LNKINGIKALG